MHRAALLLLVLPIHISSLMAQDNAADVAQQKSVEDPKLEFLIREIQAECRRVATTRMLLRADALARKFNLPEKARSRLLLAAKGAAKEYVKRQSPSHLKQFSQHVAIVDAPFTMNGRLVVPPGVKAKETDAFVPKVIIGMNEYGALISIRQKGRGSGTNLSPGLKTLYSEPIWGNELKKLFTKTQLNEFEDSEKERVAAAASAVLLGYLHGTLNFGDEQYPRIKKFLLARFQQARNTLRSTHMERPTIRPLASAEKEFEALLTPLQLRRWRECQRSFQNGVLR